MSEPLFISFESSQHALGRTAWGIEAFDSNGERIYFTVSNDRGTTITYTGGPTTGMMMGGYTWTGASCHGPDGHGGAHTMHMQTMNAPDIGWSVLASDMESEHGGESKDVHGSDDYNLETFRLAVVDGKHPDGTPLSTNMPRWTISDEDLAWGAAQHPAGQRAFLHRACYNIAARAGRYTAELEQMVDASTTEKAI